MQTLARTLMFVALCLIMSDCVIGNPLLGQSKDPKVPSGSISGRITLNRKPAPAVTVILLTRNEDLPDGQTFARATTDQDGRFRIGDLPAGSFKLIVFAPAFVVADQGSPEKLVTLASGEALEGVDISLKRGGVITGKVTDSNGRPMVEVRVNLAAIDEQGRKHQFDPVNWASAQTDDRGVYRIFGVPEGRYTASVGEAPGQNSNSVRGNTYYPMTFHPDVTDESKAAVIELAAGAEATGINIVVGRAAKAYTVSGRIVDAETGKPISGVSYGYGILYDGRGIHAISLPGNRTDTQGGFRLEGLTPNRYAAFVIKESGSEYYSDPAPFEITDADVSGIEIKLRRGSSISGVVMIEGLPDRDVAEKLAALRIRAFTESAELSAPFSSPSKIGPDGSFRITGLRPGKVKLSLGGYPPPKGFALTRLERGGIEQRDFAVEIGADEQVSGVRITIAYGTGVIRGQLKITSEAHPAASGFSVRLNRVGTDSRRPDWWTEVDDRGRFLFEEIPAGDYELIVTGYITVPGGQPSRLPDVKKQVTVTNDAESEVTIVIDLSAKEKDN